MWNKKALHPAKSRSVYIYPIYLKRVLSEDFPNILLEILLTITADRPFNYIL